MKGLCRVVKGGEDQVFCGLLNRTRILPSLPNGKKTAQTLPNGMARLGEGCHTLYTTS